MLLVVSGSTSPTGKVTLAVLDNVPLAGAVPMTVKVIAPPAGNAGMVMFRLLPAATLAGQVAPPVAAPQVVVTAVNAAGTASVTTVPLAAAGPAFDTVMVYVTCPLAATLAGPFF
jgi:hypothetical protein